MPWLWLATAVAARPAPLARPWGRSIPPNWGMIVWAHAFLSLRERTGETYRKPIRWRGRWARTFLSLRERTGEAYRKPIRQRGR